MLWTVLWLDVRRVLIHFRFLLIQPFLYLVDLSLEVEHAFLFFGEECLAGYLSLRLVRGG